MRRTGGSSWRSARPFRSRFAERRDPRALLPILHPNALPLLGYRGYLSDMTKADIVENVYEKVGGFSKKEAAEFVENVFDTI